MGSSSHPKWLEIVNLPTSPASDDSLVHALLAFANGGEVLLSQWRAATVEEKQAHPLAPPELRNRFTELLRLAVNDPKQLRDQFMSPTLAVDTRVEPSGRKLEDLIAASEVARAEAERKFNIALEAVTHGPLQYNRESAIRAGEWMSPAERLVWLLRVRHSITSAPHGFSLEYFHYFPDLETALSYAVMLLIDARKPYGAAISQCHLARCRRFFMATKNPRGGRTKRKYCCPKHLEEHHNSPERKAATTARAQARKHK